MGKVRRYDPKITPFTKTIGFLLYLFIIPPLISVIVALFTLDIKAFLLNFIAFLLYAFALYFSKKGFEQEFEYNKATMAKAPKVPYKTIGAFTLAGAVIYSSFVLGSYSFVESLFLGVIALVGYYLWYGFDPSKDKIPDTGDISADVALETIASAKEGIRKSEDLLSKIRNQELRSRVKRALKKAQEVVAELERKPEYVRELRRFLVVFIDSLYDVTSSYVKVEETLDEGQKKALLYLMDDVEERFAKELEKVKSKGTFDFEVKMETLDRQIKH
ncbi:MAG: hypothetical protein C6H99_01390 [Epsilonproteobacteria bacterium]|nr:hypothetical protein [Campylobacterota bacterium]NPA63888.1 hypothetical protein [Campylobacterota bacterium]